MATRKSANKGKAEEDRGGVAALRAGRRQRGSRRLWEGFKSIAGTIAIFLILRTFFIEAYRIPSGSMIPSLLIGDWLFVNKLRYGPHIPFTNSTIPGYARPQRGDVIVFESPFQPDEAAIGHDPTPILVKRLIGMPGDTIYMRDAVVYVDGIAQRLSETSPDQARGDGSETNPLFDWQHTIEIRGSRFGAPPAQPTHDNWGPLVIPAGNYFMMGDNRYDSKDSRYWGLVPRANIRGHPLFIYYSYVTGGYSDRPLSFITDIRWGRLGHWVK